MSGEEQKGDGAATGPSEEAERRGGFLGFVAHEVRNPLSTALWSAELLTRMSPEERGGARGEKLTAMCLRSLGRVRQLVEDHFLCERLDVGGLPVRREAVSLRGVVEDVIARRGVTAPAVAVEIPPELAVSVDRALLERAVESLLAASAGEGALLAVRAGGAGERVAVTFSGAPASEAALEDPRKGAPSDAKGRALSVPVARRIAAALGGGLAVEGGAFVLTLPAAETYTARPDSAAHP